MTNTVLAIRPDMPGLLDARPVDLAVPTSPPASELLERYRDVRAFSEAISAPLEPEDYVIQSMPDVSPTKWHLAHTSWFFETFVLKTFLQGYEAPHPEYNFLFNSYYNSVGERHCRATRGVLSRPTVSETFAYRRQIDEAMERLLTEASPALMSQLEPVVVLGLHHEQQHQELMLTDIKHVFAQNPLFPAYQARKLITPALPSREWVRCEGGLHEIGTNAEGFYFDNEGPRHRVWLEPFELATTLVTCGDWLEFMADGGYRRPELWLSAGWATVQSQKWETPFYWEMTNGSWHTFTLSGLRPVEAHEPVCHVSYYEADAFARWAEARLPTEAEWEVVARDATLEGNFAESGQFNPVPPAAKREFFGNVWQWTRSQYSPYPGYAAAPGALGEYNGKFMCNQFVLRGGSCATSRSHIRATYRNFFPPEARWQFSGLRLARDV